MVGALQFPSMIPNAPFIVLSGPALLERSCRRPRTGPRPERGVGRRAIATRSRCSEPTASIPGAVARTAPIEGFLAQLPQSLALGMNFVAAAGGAGLVVVGVAAGLYFAQRRRDYEFAALRAMGDRRPDRSSGRSRSSRCCSSASRSSPASAWATLLLV